MIGIRYYGVLTDLAGKTTDNINSNEVSTFAELKNILEKRYPEFGNYPIVFFQNLKHCTLESAILKGDEIDCMPPFSGG